MTVQYYKMKFTALAETQQIYWLFVLKSEMKDQGDVQRTPLCRNRKDLSKKKTPTCSPLKNYSLFKQKRQKQFDSDLEYK